MRRARGLVAIRLAFAAPAALALFFVVVLVLVVPEAARADPGADTARVRVRGSGASGIERAIARVLAEHRIRVVKGRKKPAAVRIDGRVRPGRRGGERVTVQLTVRRGAEVIGSMRVRAASARAAARTIERDLWGEIGTAVAGAPPAPVEAAPPVRAAVSPRRRAPRPVRSRRTRVAAAPAAPDATAEVDASTADATEPGGADRWLSVAVGAELYARHFSYRDDLFEALNEYDLAGTPALTFTAEAYPLASRRRDALAGIGGAARFTHVPSFDSEDLAGARYTSKARSYALGGRYRRRIARVDVAGALDYGSQSFSIASAGDAPDPDFPAVRYHYLRAGLSAAAPVWSRYAIAGAVGYRQVLSTGEIESDDFFPRASARGLDLELELSAAIGWGFDVRAGAALERYGFALDPEPGDARVAGGALDQYARFYVRLGFTR